MTCARPECGHPRAIHAGEACRIGGCTCTGFDDGKKRPAGPRRVSIDVPDGYALSISLTPWNAEELGAFAQGGATGQAGPIVVGERGPEIFVPNERGEILPNEATDR